MATSAPSTTDTITEQPRADDQPPQESVATATSTHDTSTKVTADSLSREVMETTSPAEGTDVSERSSQTDSQSCSQPTPPIPASSGQDKTEKMTAKVPDASTPAETAVSTGTEGRGERGSTPPVTEGSPSPSQPQAHTGVPPLTHSVTAPAAVTSGDNPSEDKSREEGDDSARGETKHLSTGATGEKTSGAKPKSKQPKLEGESATATEKKSGKESETKDKSTPQDKPWSLWRSSTAPSETREYIEGLSLVEKRKLYKCGKNYVQLEDIQKWPAFKRTNNCQSQRTLKIPIPTDDAISSKISLWRGDITKLEIGAIVNAANRSLLGGGGVDGAIHDAAGRSLYRECYELDGCDTGYAKITCGYRLPARYIIHTVGPMGERKEALKSCYQACLRLVEQNNIKSVAFCCISTGIYGYPNQNAAVLAMRTVRDWFETSNYAKTQMERVIFCVFLKGDYEIYSELLCIFFPTSPPITAISGQDKAEKMTAKDPGSSTKTETAASEETEGREETPVTKESPSPSQTETSTGVTPSTTSITAPVGVTSGDNPSEDKTGEEGDESARDDTQPPSTGATREETEPLLTGATREETNGAEPKSKQPKLEGESVTVNEATTSEKGAEGMSISCDSARDDTQPPSTGEGKETEPLLTGATREETSGAEPKSKQPKLEGESVTDTVTPNEATTSEKGAEEMGDKPTENRNAD